MRLGSLPDIKALKHINFAISQTVNLTVNYCNYHLSYLNGYFFDTVYIYSF